MRPVGLMAIQASRLLPSTTLRVVENTVDRSFYVKEENLPLEIQEQVEAAREVMRAHQRGEAVRTYKSARSHR